MLIGCLLPIALIFILPLFGVSDGVIIFIFVLLMFGCHLFMLGGHADHDHGAGAKGETHEPH